MNWYKSLQKHKHFSLHNLPYGIYATADKGKRAGVAVGDYILDLSALFHKGFFAGILNENPFNNDYLNEFISLGKDAHIKVREALKDILTNSVDIISAQEDFFLDKQADATMYLPVQVGDYTDFYSSESHATNVGKMFRPNQDALMPNWKHLPVAYHGRSSSIVTTNTPVKRPQGQLQEGEKIIFSECKKLDIEIELGFIIGKENDLGQPIGIDEARDHIFGVVLLNDFSARDIQRWEYVPLGPFLSKNFATSISPWVVTLEALEPFLKPAPVQDVEVLPYLHQKERKNFDIQIDFSLETEAGQKATIARTNATNLYWTAEQQVTHHTINGCNVRVGDLLGTGTISGTEKHSFGSMLELTWNGAEKIKIGNEERVFLQDGDTTILTATCTNGDISLGFGELRNKIIPSK